MSLRKRLFLAARTELTAVFRKLTNTKSVISDSIERELKEAEAKLEARQTQGRESSSSPMANMPVQISRAYANLELPIGANADEVRAAYRRLMKRYHPDQHHRDSGKAQAANELTRKLKDAHDALLEFLG